jgi:hypothetical protein
VAKDEERIAGASKIEAPSEQNVEKKPSDATAKLDANTTKDSAPEGHCAHDAFYACIWRSIHPRLAGEMILYELISNLGSRFSQFLLTRQSLLLLIIHQARSNQLTTILMPPTGQTSSSRQSTLGKSTTT